MCFPGSLQQGIVGRGKGDEACSQGTRQAMAQETIVLKRSHPRTFPCPAPPFSYHIVHSLRNASNGRETAVLKRCVCMCIPAHLSFWPSVLKRRTLTHSHTSAPTPNLSPVIPAAGEMVHMMAMCPLPLSECCRMRVSFESLNTMCLWPSPRARMTWPSHSRLLLMLLACRGSSKGHAGC